MLLCIVTLSEMDPSIALGGRSIGLVRFSASLGVEKYDIDSTVSQNRCEQGGANADSAAMTEWTGLRGPMNRIGLRRAGTGRVGGGAAQRPLLRYYGPQRRFADAGWVLPR